MGLKVSKRVGGVKGGGGVRAKKNPQLWGLRIDRGEFGIMCVSRLVGNAWMIPREKGWLVLGDGLLRQPGGVVQKPDIVPVFGDFADVNRRGVADHIKVLTGGLGEGFAPGQAREKDRRHRQQAKHAKLHVESPVTEKLIVNSSK